MGKAPARVAICAVLAAASTAPFFGHGQSSDDAAPAGVFAQLAQRPFGTAERAALYGAAARADSRALEALLAQAAALRDPAARKFALDVLLARHLELDPRGAIDAAERLALPRDAMAALYRAWLELAPTAAIDALDALDDAELQRLAPDLVSPIGGDELLVNRLLALVPPAVADQLLVVSLSRVAQDSPADALARAREIFDPRARDNAVRSVLFAWAERDPLAALEGIEKLEEPLRSSMLPYTLGRLAQRDPRAALERLEAVPAGAMRDGIVQAVARSFAERDPDAALAWARSLQPPDPGALRAAIGGVAARDPLRAFDLAAEIAAPNEQIQALQASIAMTMVHDSAAAQRLLDRVIELPNAAQRQGLMQAALGNWASLAPAAAAEWLLANVEHAPDNVIAQVAGQYAQVDRAQAAAYADRLSGDARGAWLRGIAGAYAAADPRGALDWVEQFRGRPEYDDTVLAVLQSGTQHDPAAAARMLDTIERQDYRRSAAGTVALRWASQDPAAAGAWAAGQVDESTRQLAVGMVAQSWALRDPAGAGSWALGLPPGATRDRALLSLVGTAARLGTLDASLLGAFSTAETRLGGVQAAALGIAQRDAGEAREFVETHVAEPAQRDRMLAAVAQMAAMRIGAASFPVAGARYASPAIPAPALNVANSVQATMPVLINANGAAVQRPAPPATRPTPR